jgi:protein-L-isoaspartate(D-aspartate) O-methyltransferase
METDDLYQEDRCQMVKKQIVGRNIHNRRLLEVMQQVPRHLFVPEDVRHLAYRDGPLPIGDGQTISQPYIVALMTVLLKLEGDENVLEIGTGSGYQAAILSQLAKTVHTVERHPRLATRASHTLQELGYTNVFVHQGDGSLGWPEAAPYDAIMITAAAPAVPPPLLQQLGEEGRLVLPIGNRFNQDLQRWQRVGTRYQPESFLPVAFVPLLGVHGWVEELWEDG